MSNLYAIYAISRVERKLGTKKFIYLTIFILIINTILETIAKSLKPSLPCSIGFSGVLFGIMTYELVSEKDLDIYILSSIAIMLAAPSMKNNNVSLISHAIGAFTGIIGGLLYINFF
jgi:membrane associated rhomboid family serine protease